MGLRNIVIAFSFAYGGYVSTFCIPRCLSPDSDYTPRFLSGYTSPELPKLSEGYKTSE